MTLTPLEARVIDGLRSLPRERAEEVLDYIDFLAARETTRYLAGRLAQTLATLQNADVDSAELSEDGCFTVIRTARV